MKRRTFFTMLGVVGTLLGISSFKFISTSFKKAAADLIKRELSFLKLDEDGLEKFTEEFSGKKNDAYRLAIRGYAFFGIDSFQSGKVHQLVSTYLLSTDFFQNKMDESKIVKYITLYNPYTRPCAHPFSHLYLK